MPHYAWSGIDIQGSTRQGVTQSFSAEQLQRELFKHDIALLSCAPHYSWWRVNQPSPQLWNNFFDSLATLLEAGVFVDTAMILLKNKTHQASFRACLDDVHQALHAGIPLGEALSGYKELFDPRALLFIESGERVGNVPRALRLAVRYYTDMADFKKRVKSVILLPAVTFGFFLIVACIILVYVVPVFASLFLSAQKELPLATRVLLQVSSWLTQQTLLVAIVAGIGSWYVGKKVVERRANIKKVKDRVLLAIPFVGSIIYRQSLYQFFQTSALLLDGSIHEVPALQAACAGLDNSYIQGCLGRVVERVNKGGSFAKALEEFPLGVAPEVEAMVAVGEESGTLVHALERSAQYYKRDVERRLQIVSSLVQPCLMIILGLCITGLIFAVYMPVLQLSYVVA